MENIKLFFEKVYADADLQEKLKAMQGMAQDEAMEAVAVLARENNFKITKEDLLKYADAAKESTMKSGELNEAELDAVAGGGPVEWILMTAGFGIGCIASLVGREIGKCAMDGRTTRF
jgi:predicted ribosomally synthesized peptide with nif11-like leader